MQKIDILLIRPNSGIPIQPAPLGLGYLAAVLKKDNINVDIKDSLIDNMSIEKTVCFIKEHCIKIVGISCCSDELPWVQELVRNIKSALDVKIIVGGPHPSSVLEEIYTDINGIDFSIYSEGEIAISSLARAILQNNLKPERLNAIPNLIWKNGGKIVKNRQKFIENLDDIDFPSWDLINPKKYSARIPHGFMYKAYPFAPMVATRGCPYSCSFCATNKIHGNKLRIRSVDNIIREIKYLSVEYGIKEFFFEDDNFTFNENFVKEFCMKIIGSNLGVFFSLPNGICADRINEEMLVLMRKANFYSFSVGVESGSQRILERMRKKTNLEMVKNKISLAKKYGFYITGFFIMGYPDETREDIMLTIKYAREINIDKAVFNKYLPLPGTESYNSLVNKGEIKRQQYFEGVTIKDIPYSPEGISRDELRDYIRKAIILFYLRPSIILKNIFRIKCNQLMSLYTIFKRFS